MKTDSFLHSDTSFIKKFLSPWHRIQEASSNIFGLDEILKECCNDAKNRFSFDLVAIQLKQPEEEIIETAKGVGLASEWSGKARHSLVSPPDLLDIQASISLSNPPRAEIISGWDKKFDPWIYETYKHEKLVRIFSPIFLIYDKSGNVINKYPKIIRWKILDTIKTNVKSSKNEHKEGIKRILLLEILKEFDNDIELEIIGTIEAGYRNSDLDYRSLYEIISDEIFFKFNKAIFEYALKIHKVRLPYVLETILNETMKLVKADSASLHYKNLPRTDITYAYEVRSGKVNRSFLKKFPPRKKGMGEKAIKKNEITIIPDKSKNHTINELENLNPDVFDYGIKAIAAFPLLIDNDNKGIFYIHFHSHHWFNVSEVELINFYGNQLIETIRNVIYIRKIREKARQFSALHSVVHSLVRDPQQKDLLKQIAWNTLNLMGADIVTIYEYNQNETIPIEKCFITPPATAGRFKHPSVMKTKLDRDDAPILLVERGEALYEDKSPSTNNILNKKSMLRQNRDRLPFVTREGIKTVAGILLKVGKEIVGVLFINYRRKHYFPKEEVEKLSTLSSFAAIAIKNQRAFLRMQHDLMVVTHQLEVPLISAVTTLSQKPKASSNVNSLLKFYRHQIEKAINWSDDALCLCQGSFKALSQEAGRKLSVNPLKINIIDEIEKLREQFLTTNLVDKQFPQIINLNFPIIKIDKDVFTSVMYCLIHNAIKYADNGSKITIKCMTSPLSVYIESIGDPIDPDEKELIFKKFRRGKIQEETGRRHSGVGLGLWVGRQLIRSIGGDLTLNLDPNYPKISKFIVHIPEKFIVGDQI